MFGSYHTDCFFQFDDYKANLNKLCVINRPDRVNEVQRSCCWNRDASAGIKHHFTHIYPEHFMFNFNYVGSESASHWRGEFQPRKLRPSFYGRAFVLKMTFHISLLYVTD